MTLALRHAEEAFARGDWPVAALLVRDDTVLGIGQNRQNTEADVTWHAEFDAMRTAARKHGAERVAGSSLYPPTQPCPLGAGAMDDAGLAQLVIGLRPATPRRPDVGAHTIRTCGRPP